MFPHARFRFWPAHTCRARGLAVALLLVAHGSAAFAAPGPKTPPLGPNILRNARFTRDSDGWTLEKHDKARVTVEWLAASAGPPGITGKVARFSVSALGTEPWHAQLLQSGLWLREGVPYSLTFWARADRERPIAVSGIAETEAGHNIGLIANGLMLGRGWRRFNLVFTPSRPVEGRNRVAFLLGDSLGTVDLAGISLRQGKASRTAGANLLGNADFARETEQWSLERAVPAAVADVSFSEEGTPPGVRGRVARFKVDALGEQNWHVQFFQRGLNLREKEPHTMTFWARADRARPLQLDVSLDMPDWHNIGLQHSVKLTPEWRKYALTFTPNQSVSHHSRLVFILGDAVGSVELAGVALRHEWDARAPEALIGAWQSRGPDGKPIRFTFNADGTGSAHEGVRRTSLSGVPRTPAPNPFRWYLQQNGQLVVAGKTYTWSLRPVGDGERLILKGGGGKPMVLERQAAEGGR